MFAPFLVASSTFERALAKLATLSEPGYIVSHFMSFLWINTARSKGSIPEASCTSASLSGFFSSFAMFMWMVHEEEWELKTINGYLFGRWANTRRGILPDVADPLICPIYHTRRSSLQYSSSVLSSASGISWKRSKWIGKWDFVSLSHIRTRPHRTAQHKNQVLEAYTDYGLLPHYRLHTSL